MTDEKPADTIIPRVIEDEMKQSYLDYAMSVIVSRALPDVRDGLKPVHRRILYAMNDLGMRHTSPHKKSARIVGEVLGKYHPHGDSAVYDSLVRLAQSFSLRYPLIDGHGNFGSIDGDRAAAMRYTEARLAKLSDELLKDLDKETVDFTENFDGSLTEPGVLPAKAPNLLINGATGIAVGMATNIPPHNLREVAAATSALIKNPDLDAQELLEHIQGPDFPTGGTIVGKSGIISAYTTGKGHLRVRSEIIREGRALIVTEIPYQVNKSQLIEQIAAAVHDKRVEGVSDLRDESDRKGMRIVIELKKDANPDVVENQLLSYTRLQVTFGVTMLALVDNRPKVLPLKEMLEHYLSHRKAVVTRRTQYELRKAEEKAHLLEGLITALDHIDAIVTLIKEAATVEAARTGLMARYELSELQANAILDLKLQKLTSLEQQKIKDELAELKERIAEYKAILASDDRILAIIDEEVASVAEQYGDERRTRIEENDEEIDLEDLIEPMDQVVTISQAGYAKRTSPDLYREQRRGGMGVKGANVKEDDFIEHLFTANTHDYLLVFTDKGKVYWKKVYHLPEGSRTSRGKAMVNLIKLEPGERINAVIPIKKFTEDEHLLFATRNGTVKKTPLTEYSRPRQGGIKAINLLDDDALVTVLKTDGKQQVLLASARGQAVKFDERDARAMGRVSTGVRGIKLKAGDAVIGAVLADDEKSLLTITRNGYGKRSSIADYRLIGRGGQGVRNIICSDRNGDVVAVRAVTDHDQLMLSTKNGIMIRSKASDIRVIGRNTQGVRVMNLRAGDEVIALARIEGEPTDEQSATEPDPRAP